MKKLLIILFVTLVFSGVNTVSYAQDDDVKAFSKIGMSLTTGTTGFGLQAATPLHPNFALRLGFTTAPFKYTYTDDIGYDGFISEEVDMELKLDMFNTSFLVDYYPWKKRSFHITAGFMVGSNKLLSVTADGLSGDRIEIGDIVIELDEYGKGEAWLDVNPVKPYVALGFGRAIPRSRVGFNFEMGTMLLGSPTIKTNNNIMENLYEEDLSDVNKLLKDFKAYPVIKFQLSFLLCKNLR